MSKHKHAELMMQYAQDWATTDRPWKLWEMTYRGAGKWFELGEHPSWNETSQYRRKPRTIRIGEYDVPEPLREEPELLDYYFMVELYNPEGYCTVRWDGDENDIYRLWSGLIHSTKEAALMHAKALRSLTSRDSGY